jgi:glucokinase
MIDKTVEGRLHQVSADFLEQGGELHLNWDHHVGDVHRAAGGIPPRIVDFLCHSEFRKRFEASADSILS